MQVPQEEGMASDMRPVLDFGQPKLKGQVLVEAAVKVSKNPAVVAFSLLLLLFSYF